MRTGRSSIASTIGRLRASCAFSCVFAVLIVLGLSCSALAQTVPPSPAQVSATRGTYPGGVRVWWTSVPGAKAYDIWRNDEADQSTARYHASVPASRNEYIDTTIPANKSYYYWVRTVIDAGVSSDFGYSQEGYWVPGPAAPDNVQASDGLYAHRVYITWNASATAEGYELWRNRDNDRSTAVRIATTAATTHWDSQVALQTGYYYWVKAYNSEGTSGFSGGNRGYAKAAPPETVTGLTASQGEFLDMIQLDWDAALGAARYEIWRADGSEQWMSERIAEVYGATSYDDTDVDVLKNYTYWVRAVNSLGYGGFSSPASGFRELMLPGRPTSISASEGMYSGRVRVVWTGGDRATQFEILRNVVRDLPSAEVIARIPPKEGGNDYWDTTAEGGRVYFYWVRGINNAGAGEASWSNIGYWNPGPDAPSNLQATDGTLPGAVEVSWVAPANAYSYEIWRHSVQDKNGAVQIGTSTTTSYMDDTVLDGELYFYWIKASNAIGTSGFSWPDSGYAQGPAPIARSLELSTENAAEGATVTLTVDLTTPGRENALAFSLHFDPNLLEFKSMSAGQDLPSGSMLIDTIDSALNGRVGAAVALSPGDELARGNYELLRVEFLVKAGASGSLAAVVFGDNPTSRDIVSVGAEPLIAQWIDGGIDVVNPASLGYEADVSPIPDGDGQVALQDWVQIGRWVAALDPAPSGSLFDRADCAPRSTVGDGSLDITDWVQAGRYSQGLDPLTYTDGTPVPVPAPYPVLTAGATTATLGTQGSATPVQVMVMSRSISGQGRVPVLVESGGGVNAVSFTIEFDAADIECRDAVIGPEIAEAGGMMIVNNSQIGEGRLGVIVAMPSGHSLPAGVRKLLDLDLALIDPEATGPFNLELSDMLVTRAVSDPDARALNAEFESGALSVADPGEGQPVPPRLRAKLKKRDEELALSWQSRLGRTYRIERSIDLSSWQSVDRVTGQPERTEFNRWLGNDPRVFMRVIEE